MDLDLALDGDAMARVLGAERCEPRYVRYLPGRRLLVLYELDGEPAHLTILRPRRTERLWARVEASPLARWVPALGGVLQHFPLDVRLPGLAAAMTPEAELVRYKPGRRAVIRYPGAYGKLRADEAGAAHVELARTLIAQGISTPEPLGYRPELRMTLHAAARGTRLATLRGGGLEAWMEPVAEALARLHATHADLPAFDMALDAADLRTAAEVAAALGADPGDLCDRLLGHLAAVEPVAATLHGSFHDDQVLVGDDGVSLVDLDSAAIGHPLLDVGHFASYLTAAGEDAARMRFLEACGAGRDALLFEAAALLRWSSLPFRDLEPGWPEAVGRRVQLARRRFADYRRSASSVMTAS